MEVGATSEKKAGESTLIALLPSLAEKQVRGKANMMESCKGHAVVKGVVTLDSHASLFNRPESHTKNRQNILVSIRYYQIVGLLYPRSTEIIK